MTVVGVCFSIIFPSFDSGRFQDVCAVVVVFFVVVVVVIVVNVDITFLAFQKMKYLRLLMKCLSLEVHLLACVTPAPHISFSPNNFHDLTIYLHKNRHSIEF